MLHRVTCGRNGLNPAGTGGAERASVLVLKIENPCCIMLRRVTAARRRISLTGSGREAGGNQREYLALGWVKDDIDLLTQWKHEECAGRLVQGGK